MSELTEDMDVQEDRVAKAIAAGLTGLLPAAVTAAGEMPVPGPDTDAKTLAKAENKWHERVESATTTFVNSAVDSIRDKVRVDAAIALLKAKFADSDPESDYKIVSGIVLDVFTRKGQGVLVTQNPYTLESERLDPAKAVEMAVEAVGNGDSDIFKTDYDGQVPGALGAKGIERFWLGQRRTDDGVLAYNSAKKATGHMARIYRHMKKTDKGKTVKTSRYVERINTWEAEFASIDDSVDEVEDYANSSEQFDELEELDAPKYPTSENDFKVWVKEQKIRNANAVLTAAKKSTGIDKKLAEMSADDFGDICEAMLAAHAAA